MKNLRFAVVGSGIGGASAAFFLRQKFPQAEVTVFEQSARAGGRVYSPVLERHPVEMGAGFIHPLNTYLTESVKRWDLKTRHETRSLGVWTGKKMFFQTSNSKWFSNLKFALTYGASESADMRRLLLQELEKFMSVYERDEPFHTTDDILDCSGQASMRQETLEDFLVYHSTLRRDSKILSHWVEPLLRMIYCQDLEGFNAFTGFLTLASICTGKTFRLVDGNDNLVDSFLDESECKLELLTHVDSWRREGDECILKVLRDDVTLTEEFFDGVIVAAPDNKVEYQSVYVTVVKGALSQKYFKKWSKLPDVVVTTREVQDFTYIARKVPGQDIFAIHSREPIANRTIAEVFDQARILKEWHWERAYPTYANKSGRAEFKKEDGLYHINSVEPLASCMEFSVLAAKNAVEHMERDVERGFVREGTKEFSFEQPV